MVMKSKKPDIKDIIKIKILYIDEIVDDKK